MIKTAPRGRYQSEAVERAMAHDGFLLSCEQRTGKCWIALNVVDRRKPKKLWIVCPIQAIRVWKEEIVKHLKVDWDCDLVIMNYDELVARKKAYYAITNTFGRKNFMIILDEAHTIKKRGTQTSKTVRTLGRRARFKLALTGTPLSQGKHDAWAIYNFMNPLIFGKYESIVDKKTGEVIQIGFADKFLIMGGFMNKKVVGYQNEDEFNRILHEHSFRVTLRESRDTPLRLRYKKIPYDLSEKTREVYEQLEEDLIVEVNKKQVKVPVVVALTMKLQQICGGFLIDSEDGQVHTLGDEATQVFSKLIDDIRPEKFVVVCRFIHELRHIAETLVRKGMSCKLVMGGLPFDGKFDTDCVLIQVQSGVAVDMAAAHHLIFYSSDFSYVNFEQMKSRILNWEKPFASFYFLLARDTIAEQVYTAVMRKKKLADLVLDKYRKRRNDRKS